MVDERPQSAATDAPEGPAPANVEGPWAYGLIAVVGLATLILAREGPPAIIIGGAATSAVFLYGFLALNPRLVGVELIVLTLGGYAILPAAPSHWMLGCGLAGGAGALLSLHADEEDNHYFIPPLMAAAATFLIFAVSRPGGWSEAVTIVAQYIESYGEVFDAILALPENDQVRTELTGLEGWEAMRRRLPLIMVSGLIALWVVVLWIFNRFARRRLGRVESLFGSLLLFRVRPGYTFLLIGALIFEILSVRLDRESLRHVSYPLFASCGVAFLLVYFGVVFYVAALRRALAPEGSGLGTALFVFAALILTPYAGPVVGLADVWFDFRKTKKIRDQFASD